MARSRKPAATRNSLRIIGGQWRGRKLVFAPVPGLRPTTDRVRETLFNWLAPVIHQARCLDLFAGSGALGLEALSRGASYCDFVDLAAPATGQLAAHLASLGATDRARCHRLAAADFLQRGPQPYDIVFVDPPFGKALVGPACAQLEAMQLLRPDALVYVETATSEGPPAVPANWRPHRDRTAGGVSYRLFMANCLPSPADTVITGRAS
jgi:16S rRNA (guanine966-N2)-methyltransferase